MGIRAWLQRRREARALEESIRFGPPYTSEVKGISTLLDGLSDRRITPGHAPVEKNADD